MKSMSELAHLFLKKALHKQAICIDATLGRGRDSRFFLDQGVHRVFAYEIQSELIELARKTIDDPRLHIFDHGHEQMKDDLSDLAGQIDAILFNFGYDPKTMDGVHTLPQTSSAAVSQALDLLRPKGRMALVFYGKAPGHEEREAVMKVVRQREDLELLEIRHPDKPSAPILLCIEKLKSQRNQGG